MLLDRLASAIRRQDWLTVLIEFVVVVAGIFIGLQVDDWNEYRKERALEVRYLERLGEDLAQDIDEMQFALDTAIKRRSMGDLLLRALEDPRAALGDPTAFITAIERAGYTFLPAINDVTFEEIRFAGHLGIIRDESLRSSIAGYYKLIERFEQWDYLRETFQVEYSNAGVGILTSEQLSRLEPVRRYREPQVVGERWTFSEADAEQALARLRDNKAFVAQIPRGASKGIEISNIRTWLAAAEALEAEIAEELARLRRR